MKIDFLVHKRTRCIDCRHYGYNFECESCDIDNDNFAEKTRFEKVNENIRKMNNLVAKEAYRDRIENSEAKTITLACINSALNDISLTLAKMYDLMEGEKE